ncbi:MAG: hypothetical protein B6I20_06370 [Bacteroidetes bacterium 4572_117]|nr:MAG: hypothetical protein B6I20_06370 [Bacteroidetes bacterium 4572_117]
MADINMQEQINEINRKLDLVLSEINTQRLKREEVEDLIDDVSIIGKDVFTNTVKTLDNAGIELDYDALNSLLIRFVRNIGTFNQMFEMLESGNDLIKDLTPIVNQVGLDAIQKMTEFEEKGYFAFFNEAVNIFDNVVTHFKPEDVRSLADNIVTIMETVKSMTQPDMLEAMNNGLLVYKSMETKDVKEYSLWKAFRAMNSPEMKRSLGFMITFMQKLSKSLNKE